MSSALQRAAMVLAAMVLAAAAAPADAGLCAPEKLVRIGTRDMTPGIDPQSFAAAPKVLYRAAGTQPAPDSLATAR